MRKNPNFILLFIMNVVLASNCYAVGQRDLDKDLARDAEQFVKENNVQKDFEVLQKSALSGHFDKNDPTIKKDFFAYWELISQANTFDRKAKLCYKIADEFNEAGFQQIIHQHNHSDEFNKVADREIEKLRKINPKTSEEKEAIFRKAALMGKFDLFDVTIRKFFENSDRETLEAKKYEKKSQELYLLSKKKQSQGFTKIMKISPENSTQN